MKSWDDEKFKKRKLIENEEDQLNQYKKRVLNQKRVDIEKKNSRKWSLSIVGHKFFFKHDFHFHKLGFIIFLPILVILKSDSFYGYLIRLSKAPIGFITEVS